MAKKTAAQRAQEKLNKLLGIEDKVAEVITKVTGKLVGVTEDEIQTFREAQGLIYFLQAPRLFTPKICPHCGEGFMVSRQFVGYCSYTCIRKSLEELGIKWSKDGKFELLAEDPQVWNGNEPLWIRSTTLASIKEMVLALEGRSKNTSETSPSQTPQKSNPVTTPLSTETEGPLPSSSTGGTTTSTPEPTTITLQTNDSKRRITFS